MLVEAVQELEGVAAADEDSLGPGSGGGRVLRLMDTGQLKAPALESLPGGGRVCILVNSLISGSERSQSGKPGLLEHRE